MLENIILRADQVMSALANLTMTGVFSFIAMTTKESLVKSRLTKNPTPENLTVIKKLVYTLVTLGESYEKLVNNQRMKEGKEADFKGRPTYCVPVDASKNLILYKHKENDQHYMRVYRDLDDKISFKTVTKYFDKNGVDITAQWKQIEAEYFTIPSNKNASQGTDEKIIVNNYKIENVKFVKRGSFVLTEVTQDILDKLAA